MKFFIDTADIDEIADAKSWGCLAGVTTNPSLYAKTGGKLADFEPHMLKIAELCEGLPVSAESTATTVEGMVEEGKRLASLAPNIVVKLPVCEAGLAHGKLDHDVGRKRGQALALLDHALDGRCGGLGRDGQALAELGDLEHVRLEVSELAAGLGVKRRVGGDAR